MMDEEPGGHAPCYLAQADEAGSIPDPRTHIRAARSAAPGSVTIEIRRGGDNHFAVLAPRVGESLQEYRVRLEGAGPRTAAWDIVLRAEACPVSLTTGEEFGEYEPVLLEYLRRLMS